MQLNILKQKRHKRVLLYYLFIKLKRTNKIQVEKTIFLFIFLTKKRAICFHIKYKTIFKKYQLTITPSSRPFYTQNSNFFINTITVYFYSKK